MIVSATPKLNYLNDQKKDKENQGKDERTNASKPLQSVQLAELSQTKSQ